MKPHHQQPELFNTQDAFCLTSERQLDGHLQLQDAIGKRTAAEDLARRQLTLIADDLTCST